MSESIFGGETPSLLQPQSSGGAISEGGLEFQMSVFLAKLPEWLAVEGFTSAIREALGDFETKFFVPDHGFRKELLEVKDHPVTPAEFWQEVARFRELDQAGDGEFTRFTLVATGLSAEIRPLANGLRRLRDPHAFYEPASALLESSYKAYIQIIERLGHTRDEADFIFRQVEMDIDWSAARSNGLALFKEAVEKFLPWYASGGRAPLETVYASLLVFCRSRRNQQMLRREIDGIFRESLPAAKEDIIPPVRIHTRSSKGESVPPGALVFAWMPFFTDDRCYPSPALWDDVLLAGLRATRDWITANRETRRIALSGHRRLSASLAFGSVFSATAGFSISVSGRDSDVWETQAHASPGTPTYDLETTGDAMNARGEDLVVTMAFIRPIASEVEEARTALGLTECQVLHLFGREPIVSAVQSNAVVADVKAAVTRALVQSNAKRIHLFFAGPSFLALLLGHRLNATTQIHCYEWVATNRYMATVKLG